MNEFHKKLDEKYPISVDFTKVLGNEVISTLNVSAFDASEDVSHSIIDRTNISNNKIAIAVVKCGENNKKYLLKFKVTTDQSNIYQEDITMFVKEE